MLLTEKVDRFYVEIYFQKTYISRNWLHLYGFSNAILSLSTLHSLTPPPWGTDTSWGLRRPQRPGGGSHTIFKPHGDRYLLNPISPPRSFLYLSLSSSTHHAYPMSPLPQGLHSNKVYLNLSLPVLLLCFVMLCFSLLCQPYWSLLLRLLSFRRHHIELLGNRWIAGQLKGWCCRITQRMLLCTILISEEF